MSLRRQIADSSFANRLVAGVFGAYLRLVRATSRVEAEGWETVERLLDNHSAVIIVCWHQRLMMTPWMFDLNRARCRSLTSDGRAGRLVGWIHRAFGYETMPMRRGMLGAGAMRDLLKGLGQGVSIGISPDGPRGPAREAKITPIQWARVTQKPMVIFTFSSRRFWAWPTWDRLMFPLPFTRIAIRWQHWDQVVPRRLSDAEAEALATDLGAAMDSLAAETDRAVGHQMPQL